MPEPYGLTEFGFSAPTFEEIRAKINAKVWGTISTTLDLSDNTYEGQLIAIFTEQILLAWKMGQEVDGVLDPDEAIDAALDAVCLLTGTFRPGAFAARTTLTLTGDPDTPVPALSLARVPDGPQFETKEDAELEELTAWAADTEYDLEDRVTNAGRVYLCIANGTSDSAGGPDTTDDDITDNEVHWRYLGDGTADADVAAESSEKGAISANTGTINEIVTPVGGWDGVINILDATPGGARMKDEQLRELREIELAKPGTGTIDAIEADLLQVEGVTAVTVFNNPSDLTVDDMPPHSVEALVMGGEDQDIWDQLHRSIGGGIATVGDEEGTAVDRRGRAHTYRFSRPDELEIYIALTVTRDPSSAPSDLGDQIKAAIVEWGDAQSNGKNAVASRIAAAAFVHDSVLDVEALIDTAPSPSADTTIEVDARELATYDTGRIDITFVDGEP